MSLSMSDAAHRRQLDLADPHWFPVDLHVPGRCFGFVNIDEGVLDRSSFLDTRIEASMSDAIPVSVSDIPSQLPEARVNWLFHTSFCGSTLASRALHLPPYLTSLREPLVLRRLGDARHSGLPIDGLIEPTLRLLARPWHGGDTVVIKPTHASLNIAADLLGATPSSRAVVLTSSLPDFLVSNLKKTAESQAKIPALAERALRASGFAQRLAPEALQPPDLLCAAALQWAAQRELVHELTERMGHARVRSMDMEWLLADLFGAMSRVADWLKVEMPPESLRQRCEQMALRNAKAMETPYGADRREQEKAMIEEWYSAPLARAQSWADEWLLPAMHPDARRNPGQWASA